MKNNFLTAYEGRKNNITPSGKEIEDTYGYEINKHGQKIVTKTGEENIYEKIQSYAEETRIENVLARIANGDTSALRPEGMYIDTTEFPQNMIEARKMMMGLENTWNSLPQEIKDHYDNDVEMFIGQSGTEKWMKDMGFIDMMEQKGEKTSEQEHGNALQKHTEHND